MKGLDATIGGGGSKASGNINYRGPCLKSFTEEQNVLSSGLFFMHVDRRVALPPSSFLIFPLSLSLSLSVSAATLSLSVSVSLPRLTQSIIPEGKEGRGRPERSGRQAWKTRYQYQGRSDGRSDCAESTLYNGPDDRRVGREDGVKGLDMERRRKKRMGVVEKRIYVRIILVVLDVNFSFAH